MGQSEESVRLRADVSAEVYEELCEKAPVPANANDAELTRWWLQYALRQWDLETARATGRYPETQEDTISTK